MFNVHTVRGGDGKEKLDCNFVSHVSGGLLWVIVKVWDNLVTSGSTPCFASRNGAIDVTLMSVSHFVG